MDLSHLTPLLTIIGGVLSFFGIGHAFQSARDAADASVQTLRALAGEYVATALEDATGIMSTDFMDGLETLVWRKLDAKGIRQTDARAIIVHEIVIVAVGTLRRQINDDAAKLLQPQIDSIAKVTQATADLLATIKPDVPVDTTASAAIANAKVLADEADAKQASMVRAAIVPTLTVKTP